MQCTIADITGQVKTRASGKHLRKEISRGNYQSLRCSNEEGEFFSDLCCIGPDLSCRIDMNASGSQMLDLKETANVRVRLINHEGKRAQLKERFKISY